MDGARFARESIGAPSGVSGSVHILVGFSSWRDQGPAAAGSPWGTLTAPPV